MQIKPIKSQIKDIIMTTGKVLIYVSLILSTWAWTGDAVGQTFTTNQSGIWNTAGIWTPSNLCSSSHSSPPPTGSYWPNCQIDITINHNVNFNLTSEFGAGYFKSLNVSNGAILTFPNAFTTASAGSNVGGVVYNVSNNSRIKVNGTTTLRSNVQVNFSTGSQLNSGSLDIDGASGVFVDGNSSISLSGNLTLRANGQLRITGSSTVTLQNLRLEGNAASIFVEAGSRLIVRGTSTMPQGPNTIIIEGFFQSGSLSVTGGQNRLIVNENGIVNIKGNLSLDGDGRLDLNGNAGVVVDGIITITNSGGNGIDQEPDTDLIVLTPGSSYANLQKVPTGGCYQSVENNFICETTACIDPVDVSINPTTMERIYIFKCSSTFTVPTSAIKGDTLEIIDSFKALTVAGGGGGGREASAGGGGAGGIVYEEDVQFTSGDVISITVGKGGAGSISSNSPGANGQNSQIEGRPMAVGGGGGGSSADSNNSNFRSGNPGGSGGGSGNTENSEVISGGQATTSTPPTITSPNNSTIFGRNGGASFALGNNRSGGGGGGAGSVGSPGSGTGVGNRKGGDGGSGISFDISGSVQFYAGGGGGNSDAQKGGGGSGIGGIANGSGASRNGASSTGSGGGATTSGAGGTGGSGIVIIRSTLLRILPVEFLSFDADYRASDRSGVLTWSTVKEWENSHFEIERAVNDTQSWETLGRVEGSGYSDTPITYSYKDENLPASGCYVFYRLRQVDLSGKFSYSNTRGIQVDPIITGKAWIAYPNPSAMSSNVKFELIDKQGFHDEKIYAQLSDIRGISSNYSAKNEDELNQLINSQLQRVRPGVYFLKLIWGDQLQTLVLIRN